MTIETTLLFFPRGKTEVLALTAGFQDHRLRVSEFVCLKSTKI